MISALEHCSHVIIDAVQTTLQYLDDKIQEVAQKIIQTYFFMGFKNLPQPVVQERNQALQDQFQATCLNCAVDAKYIQAPQTTRTGNILVICLNTTYQDHHPRHWLPFLENGSDIVLWNAKGTTPKEYEANLITVLHALRREKPQAKIALKTYCANTDPAISAAASMNFPIPLIIDRGHGDALSLARSVTIFAELPFVQRILKKDFVCGGINKIQNLTGPILFLTPKYGDQMMDSKRGNLTKALARPGSKIKLIPGDHWSKWGKTAYRQALRFLESEQLASGHHFDKNAYKDPLPPSFFKRHCLPLLIKTPC